MPTIGNLTKRKRPKTQSVETAGEITLILINQNYSKAMINIYIKAPIWKTESIGINKKIIKDDLLVEITYTKADGERLYPHVYYMRKDIALRYPIQEVSGGVKLHIIPIHDLTVLTKDQVEYAQYCQVERIPFRIQYEPKVVPPEPKKEEVELPKKAEISKSAQQRMDWVNN